MSAFFDAESRRVLAMTGTCKSCDRKVTAGDLDWVLSRIEQDEVYAL